MRINFKPKNQDEVFSILLFYWAYWWRAMLWATLIIIPAAVLYFGLVFNSSSPILALVFFVLSIVPLILLLGVGVTLYLFRKLVPKRFKTFSVKWTISEPQSLFERRYLKKVLIYSGVSLLSGIIVSEIFLLSIIFQAFLFYLFIKNEWLPFIIEAKEEGTKLI